MTAWLQFGGGLVLLLIGADAFVRGCVSLALRLKISPTTVGLTIVALGTSLPELVIGVMDNQTGSGAVAVSAMLGSNLFNIGCVLALTSIIYPIAILGRTVRLEYPFMLGTVLLLWWLLYSQGEPIVLDRSDGVVLLMSSLAFVAFLIVRAKFYASRRFKTQVEETLEDADMPSMGVAGMLAFIIVGPVLLFFGGDLSLEGARSLAQSWGWSEYVIGLTVVAFSTSAPELAVSAVAAFRKNTEVAIGNVIGSCIFNLGLVLGLSSILKPLPVESRVLHEDICWLAGFTVLVLPLMLYGRRLGPWDGVLLLVAFLTYYGILIFG
ncbi:MAG: calcium/sodium antiporter [Planctomycetota bacterium]